MREIEVGLFGTCNGSEWREILISKLKCKYFNPISNNWTEEDQEIEIEKRKTCDILLYCITPKMTGVYSIAELVYDSCNTPEKVIFCYLTIDELDEFDEHQIKSIQMVEKMIQNNGSATFNNLYTLAEYINNL